jgi:hypothetical protein
MPTNKDAILTQERELVSEAKPESFFSILRIDEGKQAVLTLDGRYQETIDAGGRFMGGYNPLRQKLVRLVDMRDRQLTVEVSNELTIRDPAPLQVELLAVVVSYRVTDSRLVSLQHQHPLGTLFDYVVESMQHAVARLQYDDFLTGGSAGQVMLNHIGQRQLDQYLGIQVINTQVSRIKGQAEVDSLLRSRWTEVQRASLDAQTMAIGRQAEREQDLQDAINDGDISKVAALTPELVARRYPELWTSMFGDRKITDAALTNALIELAKMGAVDVGPLLAGMNLPGGGGRKSLSTGGSPGGQQLRGLGSGQDVTPARQTAAEEWPSGLPVSERLVEEAARIEKAFGVAPVIRQDGLGTVLHVDLQLAGGRKLEIFLVCPPGFPAAAPNAGVVVDGIEEAFASRALQQWTSRRSLVEIVDDVVQYHS